MKKWVLVTGASSGIGKALCHELVKRGWNVAGLARSSQDLQALHRELGDAFTPLLCDVSKKEQVDSASLQLLKRGIKPMLFFLNAGIAGEKASENPIAFDLAFHENVMAVNYFGVLSFVEFWEKILKGKGGAHFIATGSVNALFAPPGASAYSASKAAIAKAFEGLSLTYFRTDLQFSVVYAGPVRTEGLKGNLPFTCEPEKMARYMADFAESKKAKGEPSYFYSALSRLFRALPVPLTMFILGKLS